MSTKTKQAKDSKPTTSVSAASAKRRAQAKASVPVVAPVAERILAPCALTPAKTSKRDQLATLLIRDEGATIERMMAATGWLPHTVRAALTGLRKQGYVIDSDKVDGLRTYRAVAPQ